MFNFLDSLNNEATGFQWSEKFGIMMILKDVLDANTDSIKLLTNHGEINLDMISKFDETYIGKKLRSAQDTNMLYH